MTDLLEKSWCMSVPAISMLPGKLISLPLVSGRWETAFFRLSAKFPAQTLNVSELCWLLPSSAIFLFLWIKDCW